MHEVVRCQRKLGCGTDGTEQHTMEVRQTMIAVPERALPSPTLLSQFNCNLHAYVKLACKKLNAGHATLPLSFSQDSYNTSKVCALLGPPKKRALNSVYTFTIAAT